MANTLNPLYNNAVAPIIERALSKETRAAIVAQKQIDEMFTRAWLRVTSTAAQMDLEQKVFDMFLRARDRVTAAQVIEFTLTRLQSEANGISDLFADLTMKPDDSGNIITVKQQEAPYINAKIVMGENYITIISTNNTTAPSCETEQEATIISQPLSEYASALQDFFLMVKNETAAARTATGAHHGALTTPNKKPFTFS